MQNTAITKPLFPAWEPPVDPSSLLVREYFREYYRHVCPRPLPTPRFRHFRVHTWDNRWVSLRAWISDGNALQRNLNRLKYSPKDVYHSALLFLSPKDVRSKDDGSFCLGGTFVIDFDINKKHLLYARQEIEEMKHKVVALTDLLADLYNLEDFTYAFSGNRGFHIHVNDFQEKVMKPKNWGYSREKYEEIQRRRLASKIQKLGHKYDAAISRDTRRVIRVPGTLNGKTGLMCKFLGSEEELLNFKIEDAIVTYPKEKRSSSCEDKLVEVSFTRNMAQFEWLGHSYEARKGEKAVLPRSLAVLLILSGDAVVWDGRK